MNPISFRHQQKEQSMRKKRTRKSLSTCKRTYKSFPQFRKSNLHKTICSGSENYNSDYQSSKIKQLLTTSALSKLGKKAAWPAFSLSQPSFSSQASEEKTQLEFFLPPLHSEAQLYSSTWVYSLNLKPKIDARLAPSSRIYFNNGPNLTLHMLLGWVRICIAWMRILLSS